LGRTPLIELRDGHFVVREQSNVERLLGRAYQTEIDDWVKLPPGQRIDELGDFLEWIANATPADEVAIRAEIKRYYYDVGDTFGGDALNRALSDVLEPGVDEEMAPAGSRIASRIIANVDPAEIAQFRSALIGSILLTPG